MQGVQWHPEALDDQLPLFKEFVNVCDQKRHIENMSNEIVDVDEILKITSETIINHIEDASVVDRQLEETKTQLVSYSKK